MNLPGKKTPDPELLAAYLDGEFEGRDGLEDLRRLVEGWLENDAEAQQLARDYRRLKQTWADTPIHDPAPLAWERMLRCTRRRSRSAEKRRPRRTWMVGLLGAAAGVCLAFGLMMFPSEREIEAVSIEPLSADLHKLVVDYAFPVASADEVIIQQVEGSDVALLVVGQLPLQGLLELVDPEDLAIQSMEPGVDNAMPQVRVGNRSPMIWARDMP